MTTRVAILSDSPARITPYGEWLAELDVDAWLFTSPRYVPEYAGALTCRGFDDYLRNRAVEHAVVEMWRREESTPSTLEASSTWSESRCSVSAWASGVRARRTRRCSGTRWP